MRGRPFTRRTTHPLGPVQPLVSSAISRTSAGDGVRVDEGRQDHVNLLVDHLLQLSCLLARVRLAVGVHDPALAAGEGLDVRLDDGVVELLVLGVRLVRQQQLHGDVIALGRARVVAAPRRVEPATAGE
jgi:hypothetical protein